MTEIKDRVIAYTNKEALSRLRTHLGMANSEYVVRDQIRINQLRTEIERVKRLPPDEEYQGEHA